MFQEQRNSFILPLRALRPEIMHNLRNDNENNSKVTATTTTTLLVLGAILIVAGVSTAPLGASIHLLQSAQAFIDPVSDRSEPKAPVVVSGDNIYVAWWTNNTSENGNEEVMFRASTDGGSTFTDKINLSNTTEADSWRVEIHGEGDTVVVSWWEMNQTSDIPVARVSNDAGATFGPLMMLGMNGTISGVEEEATPEEEGEGEEEEAAAAEGVIEEAIGGP
jgi:hypothetical protein